MALYFTRRTYNAQNNIFTNNVAALTRYVELGANNRGRSLERDAWLALVEADMKSPDITIFVHGFNTPQASMLQRRAKLESVLRAQGYRGAVLAFDWPSDGVVFNYSRDRKDAKKSAPSLVVDGVLPLLSLPARPKVNLIAHSMGAYLTLRALSEFGDAAGPGGAPWKLNEVVFVSADADTAWFGKGAWGSLLLAHRANRFTNYFSQHDDTLNLPALLTNRFAKRVGRTGMPDLVADNHVDIYSHEQYFKDVAFEDRDTITSHTWWFDNDAWGRDLAQTLAGDADQGRPSRRPTDRGGLALFS